MTIKKSYLDLVTFLEENKAKKVSSILDEIYAMTKQSHKAKTFLLNDKGEVYAVFCYYHKQWELLDEVPYGVKASSTTGFNTMCKVGTSEWTKQNNAAKQVGSTVLTMLEQGDIQADEIAETKERLLEAAKQINTTNMPIGYQTEEDAEQAYLSK